MNKLKLFILFSGTIIFFKMFKGQKQKIRKSLLIKLLFVVSLVTPFNNINLFRGAYAGLEFQWDNNSNFRRLKWYQLDNERIARNTTYFFLRPSDRKSGILKIDMKFPKKYLSNLKKEKVNLCKVQIGGFSDLTKCVENIPADYEINKVEGKINLTIYPYSPIPASKDSYAVVVKAFNPMRSGLYQVHSYGQSAGAIPVSSYLGSWTIGID